MRRNWIPYTSRLDLRETEDHQYTHVQHRDMYLQSDGAGGLYFIPAEEGLMEGFIMIDETNIDQVPDEYDELAAPPRRRVRLIDQGLEPPRVEVNIRPPAQLELNLNSTQEQTFDFFNSQLLSPAFDAYIQPWTAEGRRFMRRITNRLSNIRNNLLDQDAINTLVRILRSRSDRDTTLSYELFKFYLMHNNEIEPEHNQFTTDFSTWKKRFQVFVVNDVNNDYFDDFIKAQFNFRIDIVLHRMTSHGIRACIDLVVDTMLPRDEREWIRAQLLAANFEQAGYTEPGFPIRPFDLSPPDKLEYWKGALVGLTTALVLSRVIWSTNLRLSEMLRLTPNYYKQAEGFGFIEAMPYLITTDDANNHVEGDLTLLSNGLLTYLETFLTRYPVQVIDIKLWMKRVMHEDPDTIDYAYLDESYFCLWINPLLLIPFDDPTITPEQIDIIRELGDEQRNRRNKKARFINRNIEHPVGLFDFWVNNRDYLRDKLANMEREDFARFLIAAVEEELEKVPDTYRGRFLGGDRNDNWAGIMVSRYMITAQFDPASADYIGQPERQIPRHNNAQTRIIPVHCAHGIRTTFKKVSLIPEIFEELGALCLFQAHWTAVNLIKIQRGGAYHSKKVRRAKLMEAFKNLSAEHQQIYIEGNLEAYNKDLKPDNIVTVVFDQLDYRAYYDQLEDPLRVTPIAVFHGHAVCTSWEKLDLWFDKAAAADDKKEVNEMNGKVQRMRDGKRIRPCKPLEEAVKDNLSKKNRAVEEGSNFERDYFFDIETCDVKDANGRINMVPYLIVVVSRQMEEPFIAWGDDCVQEFLNWFDTKVPKKTPASGSYSPESMINMIGYNSYKFDLIPLMRGLATWDNFDLQGSMNDIKTLEIAACRFYDLYKILPIGSLDSQARIWNTEHRKKEFDHTKVTRAWLENTPIEEGVEAIQYCINDCVVLMEVWEAYCNHIIKIMDISPYQWSAASLAFNSWRRSIYGSGFKIEGVDQAYYDILRESYKGGITNVTWNKLPPGRAANWYDINSSYPASMSKYKIPVELYGSVQRLYHRELATLNCSCHPLNDQILYAVQGMKFDSDFWLPLHASRHVDRLNYNLHQKDIEYIWGVELKAHLATGFVKEGVIIQEFIFNTAPIFKKFVDTLYAERLEAKAKDDELTSELCKLRLNSTYGKTAQQLYPKTAIIRRERLSYYLNLASTTVDIDDIDPLGGDLYKITFTDIEYARQIGSNIHIASFITAASRAELINTITEVTKQYTIRNVMYMDTDSILLMENEDGSDPFPTARMSTTELGKWKKEERIVEFICLGKKSYYCKFDKPDKKGNTEKIRCKGVKKGQITKEHFQLVLEEGMVEVSCGTLWLRCLKDGIVYKHNATKKLKPTYDRYFFLDGSSIPYIYDNKH